MTVRLIGVALVLAAIGGGLAVSLPAVTEGAAALPTIRPERGDVEVTFHARGELAPHQARTLNAPPIGAALQLVQLAPAGTVVKEGDIVLAFDPEAQRESLAQARSEVEEAEQEIIKLHADARVRSAEDTLAIVQARFDVRRKELRVAGNEFVGAIEAQKNLLDLEEAKRKLAQLEADVRTRATGHEAALTSLTEKRRKAQIAMELAERHIESMTVRAPIAGLVTINQNFGATGGFGFPGMTIPEYREGDSVQPGSSVASIVDISVIEVNAKLDESARTALSEGSRAAVHIEAGPAKPLSAKARSLGGVAARASFWDVGSGREFDASFRIERSMPWLRPGMTAALVAEAEPVKGVLHLPRQALFDREGRSVVYVRRGGAFVPVEVKVLRLTESRVVLEGVSPDDDVALANPDRSTVTTEKPAAAPLPSAGGRS